MDFSYLIFEIYLKEILTNNYYFKDIICNYCVFVNWSFNKFEYCFFISMKINEKHHTKNIRHEFKDNLRSNV